MWNSNSLRSRRWGSLSKEESNESIGRDPLRQLPVKCSSSIVCTNSVSRLTQPKDRLVRAILNIHLYRWSIGGLAHPEIQILALSCFEEKNIIAII